MKKEKHSKYYYDFDRNKLINPKMFMSKEELGIDYKENKTPNYYIGNVYGYEARKVIEDFDLSYNLGTATSYILRCSRKHETAVDCIQKAINHLEFELDKIKNAKANI